MNDLILIKKYYGEEMMHLCKKLFPTILEEEGKLFSILSEHFAYNKFLYEDIISQDMIISFTNFIYSFAGIDITDVITDKNPFELMEEAGYILYECKTEEEINSFKKYYKNGEELCTFDSDRLEECYVFFAVKKGGQKRPPQRIQLICAEKEKSICSLLKAKEYISLCSSNTFSTFRIPYPCARIARISSSETPAARSGSSVWARCSSGYFS